MLEIIALPTARLGTTRALAVHRFGVPGARPKAYLQAALHADETPALLVAHHLIGLLAAAKVRGEVVVAPLANPIGLDQVVLDTHVGRHALSGAGNFNRDFPDLAAIVEARVAERLGPDADANTILIRAAMAEALAARRPESPVAGWRQTLYALAFDADLVLDLHCDAEATLHLYTLAELWPELADVADELGCRAAIAGYSAGAFPFDEACSAIWMTLARRLSGRAAVALACQAATVELRGKGDVSDAMAAADAQALMRVLTRRGFVEGEAGEPPARACPAMPLDGLDQVVAPASGVLVFKVAVGAKVAAGQRVADIVDPTAADPAMARAPVIARADGLVVARAQRRFVGHGDRVMMIAGATSLPAGERGPLFD